MDHKLPLLVLVCVYGQVFACTTSGWSNWINKNTPSYKRFPEEIGKTELSNTQTGGDFENKDGLPRGYCQYPQGNLTKIECASANGTAYKTAQGYHGNGLECVLSTGFICRNRFTVAKFCIDYKIRYYCSCSGAPASPLSSAVSKSTSGGGSQTTRTVAMTTTVNKKNSVSNGTPSKGTVVTVVTKGSGSTSGQTQVGGNVTNQGPGQASASTKGKNAARAMTSPRFAILVLAVITWFLSMR